MSRWIVAAAVVLVLTGEASAGGYYTQGNELVEQCRGHGAGKLTSKLGFCIGYIVSVVDVLSGGDDIAGWRACFPAGATGTQLIEVAETQLRKHPEYWHLGAPVQLARALSEAFPCE